MPLSGKGSAKGARTSKDAPDAAFDQWLQNGLHSMFDDVTNEPIPEALLRLIEQDRQK
ncbi:NepR family anti-sigma factor [Roseomonas elaeocarpi]|uniref:NepR family anti-sigma factor n=1 Tax=Roseomonas elaeocarpi TaxID=907779 RepID=A0ABV6JYI7_9PROT